MVGFGKGVLSRDPHQLRNNGTNANTTRRDEGSFITSRQLFELKLTRLRILYKPFIVCYLLFFKGGHVGPGGEIA